MKSLEDLLYFQKNEKAAVLHASHHSIRKKK